MKWIVLFVALWGCGSPIPEPYDRGAPVEVQEPEAVALVDVDPAAFGVLSKSSCGATAIGARHVMTAAHCLAKRDNRPLPVEPGAEGPGYVDGATWAASAGGFAPLVATVVVWSDVARDLAMLETAEDLPAWLPVRSVADREPVWAIVQRAAPTRFDELLDESGEAGWLSTAPVEVGDSGSPVVGADGSLVGVLVSCEGDVEAQTCRGGGWYTEVMP
jgi:hypothetical protein